jgi:mono/diheme cytochrome c family protein
MNFIKSSLVLAGVGILIGAGTLYSGLINPGADEPHSPIVYKLIQTVRDRAIAVRADDLVVPALSDAAMIQQGAGNYAAMCTGCHLAPGVESTEMSKILYPAPPNLSKLGAPDPARAFWVIKHGVKASGMAAWGKNIKDDYIWNMVAFLKQLPSMTPEQYQTLVDSSGGHSHGGGEDTQHSHDEIQEDTGGMTGTMHGDDKEQADHHEHSNEDVAPNDETKTPEKPIIDESKPHHHPSEFKH